jgi:hypothetical protein
MAKAKYPSGSRTVIWREKYWKGEDKKGGKCEIKMKQDKRKRENGTNEG